MGRRCLTSWGPLVSHAMRVDAEAWEAFDGLRRRKAMSWPAFLRWLLALAGAAS